MSTLTGLVETICVQWQTGPDHRGRCDYWPRHARLAAHHCPAPHAISMQEGPGAPARTESDTCVAQATWHVSMAQPHCVHRRVMSASARICLDATAFWGLGGMDTWCANRTTSWDVVVQRGQSKHWTAYREAEE